MQGLEDATINAGSTPGAVVVINRLPLAEAFGQVSPRRSGAEDPHAAIEHQAGILGLATCFGRALGNQRLEKFPLLISDFVAAILPHSPLPLSELCRPLRRLVLPLHERLLSFMNYRRHI